MTSPKQSEPDPNSQSPYTPTVVPGDGNLAGPILGRFGDAFKFTAVLVVMVVAIWFVSKKLKGVTWEEVRLGFDNLPTIHILGALLLTAINYLILTGYDWIAIRFMRKRLSFPRMMAGAIVGYASGNVLGWLFGGNAARYRMYSKWGFSTLEIIGLVSILSVTFWLGLFLLAGIAFIALPIHLPPSVAEHFKIESKLFGNFELSQHMFGYIFLGCVLVYLLACLFIRKPIRFKGMSVSLPPFRLSAMQLVVSALDFLLATTTLYVLLPPDIVGPDKINFSTVLIAYLTAQIAAVLTHVPGGYGILEGILIAFLEGPTEDRTGSIVCAVIMFRIIYYLIPFCVAGILFVINEYSPALKREDTADGI
jgi:phosphatidylglycerol lysyltransferase